MRYLNRKIDEDLLRWKNAPHRKVILVRGARQVGKSSAVRELGKNFDHFVEINLEKQPQLKVVFEPDSVVQRIVKELSFELNTPIIPGKTLLFIDEIQSCIPAISALRYFYEDMPELHVIAAGSLFEFALEKIPSFGVGRIRSLFMYPFSYDEFIRAMGFTMVADELKTCSPQKPVFEALHQKCKRLLIEFMLIGGMPEVVAAYVESGSLFECQEILEDIVQTFYHDFAKYKQRANVALLQEVFGAIIEQTGEKFTYSRVSNTANFMQIKECVTMLEMAGLVYPVTHTAANGLPLAAEQNIKFRKYLIFDTGIYQRFFKLNLADSLYAQRLEQINKGAFAELFAGIEIMKASPAHFPLSLNYWQREKAGSNAEVDYVVQQGEQIVPVEVKANTKGSMQSLFQFLAEKGYSYGIRASMENFGVCGNIRIYPLYAIAQYLNNAEA
ncbi:MAG: AAA family ATPase [Bacteroidetes bacterium]|nr:AAA family ATPase [Bacteroidota bacterium]